MPIREQKNQPEQTLNVHRELIQSFQKKALLIEDNYLILHLHGRYLIDLGFSVDIANTQEKALEYAFNKSYDLILTDLGLEDSCNEAIITNLRKLPLNQKIPLIVVTATSNESLKSRCLEAGANAFIVKPLKKEILQQLLADKNPSFLRSEAN